MPWLYTLSHWASLISQNAMSWAFLRTRPVSVSWRWRGEESELSRSLNSWGTRLHWSKALLLTAHVRSSKFSERLDSDSSARHRRLHSSRALLFSAARCARYGVSKRKRFSDFRHQLRFLTKLRATKWNDTEEKHDVVKKIPTLDCFIPYPQSRAI